MAPPVETKAAPAPPAPPIAVTEAKPKTEAVTKPRPEPLPQADPAPHTTNKTETAARPTVEESSPRPTVPKPKAPLLKVEAPKAETNPTQIAKATVPAPAIVNSNLIAQLRIKADREQDPKARFELGTRLVNGRGVARNPAEGIKYLEQAAAQDFVPAQSALGAVYLDGGVEAARAMVVSHVAPRLERALGGLHRLDRKSALQERLAAEGRVPPEYRSSATGPDHDKVFTAQVLCDGAVLGVGSGRSKKDAEQAAALIAPLEVELDGLEQGRVDDELARLEAIRLALRAQGQDLLVEAVQGLLNTKQGGGR